MLVHSLRLYGRYGLSGNAAWESYNMANIMIVEDEGIVARDIRRRLTKMGYDVVAVADSGEMALKLVAEVRPDLVLMDIILKGELDGTQTARQLYDEYHIPVIYLTAHADYATVQRAKESEPFGYVVKPFQEQDLKTSIEMALVKHQSEMRLRQSTLTLQESNELLEKRVAERTANLEEAIVLLKQEIQERKVAQKTLQERDWQLRQAQKMEAVGRLAGGVTHDFNNQLAIIRGYLDMAVEQLGEHPPVTRYLNQIGGAVDRATGLTRQLLLFTSHQPVDLKVINLNHQINDFKEMLRRLLREDIELEVDLEEALWSVRADAVNIDQVVTNLVVNARDAMPRGGKLTIQTRNVVLSADHVSDHVAFHSGEYVHLMVRDTGEGMKPETLSKIFEPFFTTKARGDGTGLGLSVVYGIVQSHGGWISAESVPQKGSCFHVYLPKCEKNKAEEKTHLTKRVGGYRGAGEHLLIVEDDAYLRNMLVVMLEEQGYVVSACGNQKDARQLLKNKELIQLILTDVMLPDGRGTEMALDVQKSHPELHTILMTGYPGTHLDLTRIRAAGLQLIQKPIARQDLLNIIHDALKKDP